MNLTYKSTQTIILNKEATPIKKMEVSKMQDLFKKMAGLLCVVSILIAGVPAMAADVVELEFYHQKPENVQLYEELVADFMAENPDIKISITLSSATTTSLVSRIAANNIPEIISIFPMSATYIQMEQEGIFTPLTGQEFLTKVNPDILKNCDVDGEYYVLPLTLNAYGLYYNVDLFNELGLEPAKTIDELWVLCEALKEKGIQAFSFPDKKTTRIAQMFDRMLVGSVDHNFHDVCVEIVDGKTSVMENQDIRTYADVILKLREYGNPDSLGYEDEPAYEEFVSGKAAMYLDGTWAVTTFETLNPELNFTCTAIPTIIEDEFYTAGTIDTAYAISATATDEQKAAALRFFDFMVRDDIAQRFCDGDKNPNIVLSVDYNVPQLDEINEMIATGRFAPALSTVWSATLRSALNTEIQGLILDKDVDAFLERFNSVLLENFGQ